MNRRTLLWLSVVAIGVLVLAAILVATGNRGLAGTLNLIGFVLWLITWVLGIIVAARASQWLWLVLIIFFTPLATLLYGLLGGRD